MNQPFTLLALKDGLYGDKLRWRSLIADGAGELDTDLAERANTIRTWLVSDGMPSDSVTAIPQMQDANLWIGTSVGLARFDGVKFTEAN